jgi:dephospho-CoA kinase
MLRVGLTGGIASGKSTAARVFGELGAHVVDADRVSRDLVMPGSPVLARIARAFGREVIRADGTLDRSRLGEIVFADEAKRRVLEGILHPLILLETDRRVEQIERMDPGAIVVVEAALILEIGRQAEFDAIVVVWAEEAQQVQRLIARDRMSLEEARNRIAAQMPLAEKRRLADYVVDNSGDPGQCRTEAERVFAELRRRAAG